MGKIQGRTPQIVGPTGTDLEGRMRGAAKGGGGIAAGAHPEFETPAPVGNPIKQIGGLIKRLTGRRGGPASPSTTSSR